MGVHSVKAVKVHSNLGHDGQRGLCLSFSLCPLQNAVAAPVGL